MLEQLHGIPLSLKRLVIFIVIHFMIHVHSMLDRIMLLFGCDMCNSSADNVSLCRYYAYCVHSDSSLPLTQSMGLEVGEPVGLGASFGMNNALCGLEDTFDMEHNLVDTPLEGCRDVFMHEGSSSLPCENVLPSAFEHSYVSTFCSQP